MNTALAPLSEPRRAHLLYQEPGTDEWRTRLVEVVSVMTWVPETQEEAEEDGRAGQTRYLVNGENRDRWVRSSWIVFDDARARRAVHYRNETERALDDLGSDQDHRPASRG